MLQHRVSQVPGMGSFGGYLRDRSNVRLAGRLRLCDLRFRMTLRGAVSPVQTPALRPNRYFLIAKFRD